MARRNHADYLNMPKSIILASAFLFGCAGGKMAIRESDFENRPYKSLVKAISYPIGGILAGGCLGAIIAGGIIITGRNYSFDEEKGLEKKLK